MLRDFSPSLSHFRREIEAPRLQSVPLPSPKVSRQESLSRSNTPPPLTDLRNFSHSASSSIFSASFPTFASRLPFILLPLLGRIAARACNCNCETARAQKRAAAPDIIYFTSSRSVRRISRLSLGSSINFRIFAVYFLYWYYYFFKLFFYIDFFIRHDYKYNKLRGRK